MGGTPRSKASILIKERLTILPLAAMPESLTHRLVIDMIQCSSSLHPVRALHKALLSPPR